MSKPEVAVFTKDNPCTKREIWNCFRGRRGFKRVQVDEAKSIIGANAPKNMIRQGYVERYEDKSVEYFELTPEGKEWLTNGIASFVKNHPESAGDVVYLPKSIAA